MAYQNVIRALYQLLPNNISQRARKKKGCARGKERRKQGDRHVGLTANGPHCRYSCRKPVIFLPLCLLRHSLAFNSAPPCVAGYFPVRDTSEWNGRRRTDTTASGKTFVRPGSGGDPKCAIYREKPRRVAAAKCLSL